MNQISDLPGDTLAGTTFNYMVWTPNTDVLLCSVPWNSDYRDIVKFDNQLAIDTYLEQNAGPHIIFNQLTFARPGMPVRIALPYNECYAFNYLRVRNNAAPVSLGGKTFYYFVTDVRYVAPNTTELMVQLDVWQSFGRDVTFGNCYVERGHVGIANTNNTVEHGRQTLIAPEGLDMGNEYQVVQQYEHPICVSDQNNPALSYEILVYSTTELDGHYGDAATPILKTATGSNFENAPSAMSCYLFTTLSDFEVFLNDIHNAPWVGQGIVSVQAIPKIYHYFNHDWQASGWNADNTLSFIDCVTGLGTYYRVLAGRIPQSVFSVADQWWRNRVMEHIESLFPGMYTHLTKFVTYPYSLIELTSYTGTPLILKPECISTDSIDVLQSNHIGIPGTRITFTPFKYNATPSSAPPYNPDGGYGSDGGEYLDMSTGITNFPTYPIVNNSYLSYLASNRNSIIYQHTSADWSQQRALSGASAEAENVGSAVYAGAKAIQSQVMQAQDTRQLNMDTETSRMGIGMGSAALNGIASIAGGNVIGGAVQAIGGVAAQGLNGVVNINQINQQTDINNKGLSQRWDYSRDQMTQVRDTNLNYAQYAARGDYGNAIAAINAKVQDAKLIQPTTAGQAGGDAFLLSTFNWGVNAKVKLVARNVIQQIGDFWMRYGYAVNRFVNMAGTGMTLQVMTKFSYWKMKETYIISTGVPEGFRQTIRGIFEKGVTVWNSPTDVGRVSIYDNEPIGGITL